MTDYFEPIQFFPNYEDYEDFQTLDPPACRYPELWPSEKAAGDVFHEMMLLRTKYPRRKDAHNRIAFAYPELVAPVLARMASEMGWTVKNTMAMAHFGVSPIYITTDDYLFIENKPKRDPNDMSIDRWQLFKMMDGMIPPPIMCDRTKPKTCTIENVVEAALVANAEEKGWQRLDPNCSCIYTKLYKI